MSDRPFSARGRDDIEAIVHPMERTPEGLVPISEGRMIKVEGVFKKKIGPKFPYDKIVIRVGGEEFRADVTDSEDAPVKITILEVPE